MFAFCAHREPAQLTARPPGRHDIQGMLGHGAHLSACRDESSECKIRGLVRVIGHDLEILETLSRNHISRESFLSDLMLDPPEALGDLAGEPVARPLSDRRPTRTR